MDPDDMQAIAAQGMRPAALHRARNVIIRQEGAATGRSLFDAALSGGSVALGARSALAPGLPADIVSLDLREPARAARNGDALLNAWIFASRRGAVDCVWRRGKKLVANGRHRARERVEARFRTALGHVLGNVLA